MDSRFGVDTDGSDVSALKGALPDLPSNPQSCGENRSHVARADSFVALADSANDVVPWRLHLYGYALTFRSDRETVYNRVASSSRLHCYPVAMRAIVPCHSPLEPPFVGQARFPSAAPVSHEK